jgi:hypothetical protein
VTVAELIRELETFQPDSEVLLALLNGGAVNDWNSGRPGVVYWDADAKKVIVEAESV